MAKFKIDYKQRAEETDWKVKEDESICSKCGGRYYDILGIGYCAECFNPESNHITDAQINEVEDDFRNIISHALLGSDTSGIDKKTFDLVVQECAKYYFYNTRLK